MTFSKLFITIACALLILVGAALGYSVKVLQQVGDLDRGVKMLRCEVETLGCRVFLLEAREIRLDLPGKSNILYSGLGPEGRKGQPRSLPVSKPLGRK